MKKYIVFAGLILGLGACSSSQVSGLSVRVLGRFSYVGDVRPTAFITGQNTSSIALTNVVLTVTCTESTASAARVTQFRGTVSVWAAGIVDVFTLNYHSGSETFSSTALCSANVTASEGPVSVSWPG